MISLLYLEGVLIKEIYVCAENYIILAYLFERYKLSRYPMPAYRLGIFHRLASLFKEHCSRTNCENFFPLHFFSLILYLFQE